MEYWGYEVDILKTMEDELYVDILVRDKVMDRILNLIHFII